ncbi:hypothetical protein ACTXJX_16470 [Glutamicibacter ardleyensis]|uniref:hypothetical protein n=1 Tax=Glutamicibacter ardleyensis TaxID=225894 RepID=UPI003FD32E19
MGKLSVEFVPSVNDRQLLTAYAGEFSDGTPRGWEFIETPQGWEITLPNSAKLNTTHLSLPAAWGETPSVDANTTVLWRNSLAYLPRILQISGSTEAITVAERVVRSFLNWFESRAAADITTLKSGSQDHQSALRLRTLLWILSFLSREERQEEYIRFLALYERLLSVENRLLEELDLYQPNNHGIMLGIAHLHSTTLFPDLHSSSDARTWVERLYATLSEIIDEEGIASENTPIYQVFYVMLLEDIVAFIDWSGKFSGRARMFQLLLRSAQIGVSRQLLPNGAVPPLGDSPGGMQFRFKPVLGHLWSPNNGLAVSSREDEYLSFVAGFRSVIHKQLDDLSIAWWQNGDFILRDAGLLSYDQNNPVAVAMRGPKGHSLPTYSQFDAWTTKNSISYGKNSSRLRGKLLSREVLDHGVKILAELAIDEAPILRRSVHLEFAERITTRDSFTSTRFGDPLVRFLLDPSIKVKLQPDNSVVLERQNFECVAKFESSKPDLSVQLEVRESYVALEHHSLAKTSELIITIPNSKEPVDIVSTFEPIKS